MARSNAKTTNCFSAAMGMKAADISRIEKLAEGYGTGDITGDYMSAVQDAIAEDTRLLQAIKDAMAPKKVGAPAVMSRPATVSPSSLERPTEQVVQQLANTFVDNFGENAPPVRVMRNGFGVVPGAAVGDKGALYNGTIYIFSDGHTTKADVLDTLWHETFHYGIRKVLSKEQFVAQMTDLAARDAALQQKADEWVATDIGQQVLADEGADFANARGVEEALADLAHTKDEPTGALARTFKAVADWLAGLADKFGLRDIAKNIRGLSDTESAAYIRGILSRTQEGESLDKQSLSSKIVPGAPVWSKAVDASIQQTANAGIAQQDDAVGRLGSMVGVQAKDAMSTAVDFFKKFAPNFLSNYQLVEQYGKKLDSLRRYVGLQQVMTQERTKQAMVFHNVAVEWDKLEKGLKERLDKLTLRATLEQIHPDVPFDDKLNSHLKPEDKAKYEQLKVQYNTLGTKAQKVYQDAKKALADQWVERQEAYNQLVDYTFSGRMADAMARNDTEGQLRLEKEGADAKAAYDKQLKQLKGPYFPLMRFGTYLAIGESAELDALKAKIKDATGDDRRAMEKQLEAMKKDAKHYEVSAHETRGQLNAAKRAMTAKGLVAREDMTDQTLDGVTKDSAKIVSEIGNMVSASFDAATASAVNDGLANVFLRSLPEMHALRREAHRKGIEGANADMLRAFASAGQSGSFYQSRLKHASEMADAMFKMKQEAKGKIDLQHVHREMERRMALDMQYKETPVQDFVASASWVYHLGMSPSNWVLNATQPWIVSAPIMAGRYGISKSTSALGKAYADATKIMKDARFKNGKMDWWSGISVDSLPNLDERKALRSLMERGIVDEGLQHELNMFSDGKSRGLAQFNRWMGWGNQQVELVNRTTTALAAFRLAQQGGATYEASLQYAYDTTLNSQFDYSQEGTARFMREGGGVPMAKLIFQFRKFQQGMLYALGSNIRKLADPKERKEAAWTLAYLSATSGLVAGATGLPLAGVVFALANAFLDDDDPEGDAETQFANWLFDVTGDKKAADVVSKGLPAMWGWDVSKRVGMGDVASPFPMGRFDGKTGAEMGGQVAMAVLGPAAGLSARMYDGATLIGQGDFDKGAERLLPKFLADGLRSTRYATEGMSDGKGNPTGTQLDAADVVSKAFGFSSTTESSYYEGTAAVKNTQTAVKARIGEIGNQFKEALRTGNMGSVRSSIAEYNDDHPENPITAKQETQWRKDARESARGRTPSGVKMGNKKDGLYNDVARFAS